MYEGIQNGLTSAQYEAKERASNYVGQGLNTASLPKPTVLAEVVNRLDLIHNNLHDILSSQKGLIERLHGTAPEKESNGVDKNLSGGALHTIDEKFNWISGLLNEIAQNQIVLNNLA